MTVEVDEKKLSNLETNALALRKIANIVLAEVESLRTASARPRSKNQLKVKDAEADIINMLLKRAQNKKKRKSA